MLNSNNLLRFVKINYYNYTVLISIQYTYKKDNKLVLLQEAKNQHKLLNILPKKHISVLVKLIINKKTMLHLWYL